MATVITIVLLLMGVASRIGLDKWSEKVILCMADHLDDEDVNIRGFKIVKRLDYLRELIPRLLFASSYVFLFYSNELALAMTSAFLILVVVLAVWRKQSLSEFGCMTDDLYISLILIRDSVILADFFFLVATAI